MLLRQPITMTEASLDRRVDEELLKWIDFEIENECDKPEEAIVLRKLAKEVRKENVRAVD
jgi:hypothetical protein